MNILTFDIEEWQLEKVLHGGRKFKYDEFDNYLYRILDYLDEHSIKATFFCLGSLIPNFDYVVKNIYARGHEIGCHSYGHTWLNRMTEKDVYDDTRTAIDLLEQCIGAKVKSYRAPAFSIGEHNKWAFDVLSKCGIEYDASIYPALREFGGFSNFIAKEPAIIEYNGCVIKEFPISTTSILGKEIAYSGGGYFRFFPLNFVKSRMKGASYAMTYFHIGDLVPDEVKIKSVEEYENYYKEPGTLKNRYMRYLKTNLGKKNAFTKMLKLVDCTDFINIEQASQLIDWSAIQVVKL
jgi:polysaccharide deacetylase family protein (PEP-CTERM system associated)